MISSYLQDNGAFLSGSTVLFAFYGGSKVYAYDADIDIFMRYSSFSAFNTLLTYILSCGYYLWSYFNETDETLHIPFAYINESLQVYLLLDV